jgi:hypothetical protein
MISLKTERQEAVEMILMSRQFENEYAYTYIYFFCPATGGCFTAGGGLMR